MGTETSDRPPGTGRWSAAAPKRWWYPIATSDQLRRRPLALTFMDLPLVAFRDGAGLPRVLVDRCPHRNVPLSLGRVCGDGTLECGYHGWRFDGTGRCTEVPALPVAATGGPSPRDAEARPACEADGMVWMWGEASEPTGAPFGLPDLGPGPTVGRVVFQRDMGCTMHASLENALDVPHTAFLHGGIFRKAGRGPRVQATRSDLVDGVEVRFTGEPAAFGPLRLPGGATFDHWDRFFLPSIAQVEYRVGDRLQIFNSILHLPLSATRTRAWFVLQFKSPLPAAALAPLVRARGRKVLEQDVEMLEAQTANIGRFGGERYTSTDLDLLGSAIWRLLRQAERADGAEGDATETPVQLGRSSVTLQL